MKFANQQETVQIPSSFLENCSMECDHDLNNIPTFLNAVRRPSAYAHARHNPDSGSQCG